MRKVKPACNSLLLRISNGDDAFVMGAIKRPTARVTWD